MPDHPALAYLRRQYPTSSINPAWLEGIVTALQDAGQAPTNDEIFIHSDLTCSTLPAPPPAASASPLGPLLFASPTLLQIHRIAEVGASACAQQTAAESRREYISGAARIRTMDDDEEVDEGRLPAYPRSMLKLEVSDGHSAMTAMEYTRLDGLTLGETPLGTKLLVTKVRLLKDTLLLAPDNTRVLGGCVDALEAEQPRLFVEALQARLADPQPKHRKPAVAARGRLTLPRTRAARAPAAPPAAPAAPAPSRRPAAPAAPAAQTAAARRRAAALAPPPSDSTDPAADDSFQVDDAFMRAMEEAERRAVGAARLGGPRGAGAVGLGDEDEAWVASGDWDDPIELSD